MTEEKSETYLTTPKVRMTLTPDWEKAGLDKGRKSIFQRVKDEIVPSPEMHPAQIKYELPIEHFLTGSSYEGTWNSLGFTGHGTYYFPHGAIYDGNFKNGQFHGRGTITYPVGHKLKCVHKNGTLIRHLFVFADGLDMHHPNHYCHMPDRRFQVEIGSSLRGAGKELLTNRQPTIEIPEGCYDTIDGFYVPSVKCIYKYDKKGKTHERRTDTLKRTVGLTKGKFIESHFRKSSIGHMGYTPELYECWITGRREEEEQAVLELKLSHKLAKRSGSLTSEESSLVNTSIEFEQLKTY